MCFSGLHCEVSLSLVGCFCRSPIRSGIADVVASWVKFAPTSTIRMSIGCSRGRMRTGCRARIRSLRCAATAARAGDVDGRGLWKISTLKQTRTSTMMMYLKRSLRVTLAKAALRHRASSIRSHRPIFSRPFRRFLKARLLLLATAAKARPMSLSYHRVQPCARKLAATSLRPCPQLLGHQLLSQPNSQFART